MEEKNITLAIASDVADLLRKQGVDVIMTREGDNYVDLGKRVETANDNNAEVFVSIHNNASTIPMVGGGAWVYTYAPDGTTLSAQRGARYHLAQLLQNNLTPLPQLPAARVCEGNFEVRDTRTPACLVEVSFYKQPKLSATRLPWVWPRP